MSDSIASRAARYAVNRTKELLLEPVRLEFLAYASIISIFGNPHKNPRIGELRRLKPYYKGTRLLAFGGLLFVVLSFLLPFSVIYVGMDGFYKLLILYVILMIALSVAGILLEAVLDAIFAIGHENRVSFIKATGQFISYSVNRPAEAAKYMIVKVIVDMSAVTLIMVLFLPCLLGAVAVMSFTVNAVRSGNTDFRSIMLIGMGFVSLLAGLAIVATSMLSVPISAFYGYYTEGAVRDMLDK